MLAKQPSSHTSVIVLDRETTYGVVARSSARLAGNAASAASDVPLAAVTGIFGSRLCHNCGHREAALRARFPIGRIRHTRDASDSNRIPSLLEGN